MNKVIVLIPHYNNSKGLIRSLMSINPSENVDILIVDDGSNIDKIADEEYIRNAFLANGKIYFLYLNEHKGIEFALNEGLSFIFTKKKHSLIARLDCGDLCVKNRFEIQKTFLMNNRDIKLVGTNAVFTNHRGEFLYNKIMPEKHRDILKKMFVNNMFVHPSVMFSTDVIASVGLYPTNRKAAEDYAFFFKIMKAFKTANIQECLLVYEINPKSISIIKRKQQVWSRILVILDNFCFGVYPVYGVLRNIVLLAIPYRLILAIKKTIK